ncbi:threonine ammonia-lyase [Tieghemostelium lacteum]|uniref:Threonine ammonia-lyase n=1 Tax=Tieghemostelium lacteum TaxID=361077 RepID=A0A152A1G8_TIELA|nr:threonine ammonia-lyase [Tieghemostelium lacteum]|eukprot:KYR00103.1 threonine ammonia-lyase [Tieghemostelium lacteum]
MSELQKHSRNSSKDTTTTTNTDIDEVDTKKIKLEKPHNTNGDKSHSSNNNNNNDNNSNNSGSNNPLKHIEGFKEIGDGIIRQKQGDDIDFLATVERLSQYTKQYLKTTPQYEYELLSQLFKCDLQLKLENLQLFGDIFVRNCMSILLGNYFNQVQRLHNKKFAEIGGFVMVYNPKESDLQSNVTGAILTALHLKFKCIIYVSPGELSLSQITRLYMCHARGAKLIFHKGDIESCVGRANQHANDMSMVFLDLRFIQQFAVLGAATLAHEMYVYSKDRETVIIPLRIYQVGWTYVSGISMYYKLVQPKIRVIVVQMTEDLVGKDTEGNEFSRQSLFPDRLELGWLALIHDQSDLTNVFDSFDSRNQGKFNKDDLENVLWNIGGDKSRNIAVMPPKSSLSQTEFVHEFINQHTFCIGQCDRRFSYFSKQFSLENLLKHEVVDTLVTVTEDQSALAFIKCMEYTHTLTNGKGAIALGGLLSGKILMKPDEKVVVMISGGFVDVIDFQTILQYGLDLTGQSFEIELDLPDNTTALSKVLSVIGDNKVSVVEVLMDRSCETLKVYHVRVTIQCHSRNFEQQTHVCEIIKGLGFKFNLTKSLVNNKDDLLKSTVLSPPYLKVGALTNSSNNLQFQPISTTTASPVKNPSTPHYVHKARKITDITVESIRAAQKRIKHIMSPTPIYHSTTYSKLCDCKVSLMLENIQKTGSFKIRGSSNMVLKSIEQSEIRPQGLVAASAGNHAQGVALISAKVGLPCTIVCPEYAPDTKLTATKQYGAEVIKHGNSLEDAVKRAEQICAERDWTLVRPYNDVDVIEGQGTMGCDIYDKIPDVDTVLVNVGGGGMIAGIALFLKRINPNIRIIGVQSANVSTLADFKQTHQLRYIEPAVLSLADGTNVKMPGGVHTQVLSDLVDEYVTVSENEIASTIVHLLYNSRTVSEGAGCLGLAALLHHKIKVRKDEKVVVIICGGNIDMSTLRQVYEYGLRSLGRSFTIHLTTWDYPGNLAKIISLASRAELKVSEIRHIRGGGDINWNEVTISLSFYSNSFHHQNFFLSLLVEEGLFPTIVGRNYIKDNEIVYQVYDKSIVKKTKELKETFTERQKQFIEQYGKQANTSTLL